MEPHVLDLDKPRKLHYGFKAIRIIKAKFGKEKELTDVLEVEVDEIPYFAYAGLVREDESLTPERVEELIDDAIPEKYTVVGIAQVIAKAITDQIGTPPGKKKAKLKTPSLTSVKSRSKSA